MKNFPISYYNTNKLSGSELVQAIKKARSQEDIILLWFLSRPNNLYAPHEILKLLDFELKNAPLTSIRRAITNLEKAGYLEKTDQMTDGLFGQPVHKWRLKTDKKPVQPSLFNNY